MKKRKLFFSSLGLILVGLFAPVSSSFASEPTLQWVFTWNYTTVPGTPLVINLTDDNEDGAVDACDDPEVAFIIGRDLVVVDGTTGQKLFDAGDDSLRECGLAAGDIVGNSIAELIALRIQPSRDSIQVVAFDATGTQVLAGDPTAALGAWVQNSTISVADLNKDGTPEILVGEAVFRGDTGDLLWDGTGGQGDFEDGARSSTGVNLDTLGNLEVLAGNTAYRSDGSIFWQFGTKDGGSAVGNYDGDDYPEVVLVADGVIYLLDSVETSTPALLDSLRFAHTEDVVFPALGQFDNDAEPEVAETDGDSLWAFDFDSASKRWEKMWVVNVTDFATMSGMSVADLDGDGTDEVIYGDNDTLWILDGSDGSVQWQTPICNPAIVGYPVAADIDGDNRMEVVVPGSNLGCRGISAYDCLSWADGRRVWNDYTYHVTNINEDGTVPVHQESSWLTHNSFLAQENECVMCDKEVYGDWTIEIVKDETSGPYNAIDLRDSTFPHISFHDENQGGLWYGYKDTIPPCGLFPQWKVVSVHSGDVGYWTSLRITSLNPIGVFSYVDFDNWDIRIAGRPIGIDSVGCEIEIGHSDVDTQGDLGTYGTDLALDSEGYPYIVYYDGTNGNLKYAESTEAGWSLVTLDSNGDVGRYPAIAIDSDGKRHVSYYDATAGDLKYISCPGNCTTPNSWTIPVVVDGLGRVGLFTEIAVDQGNFPHISYIDSSNKSLKYARKITFDWERFVAENEANPQDLIASTSIGLDQSGNPHISYSDRNRKTLKYATSSFPWTDWTLITIPDPWDNVGLWNSIAVGVDDTVHISYSASDSVCSFKALKYAKGKP